MLKSLRPLVVHAWAHLRLVTMPRDDLAEPSVRYDMRSLRRTNRTVAFSTRITAELDARIRTLAMRDNIMLTELLERAIEAYDRGDPK